MTTTYTPGWNPAFSAAIASIAPPTSEDARVAADIEVKRRLESGEQLRRDIDRTHLKELNWGDHS